MNVSGLAHIGLHVTNMEETLRFYEECLGLQKIFELKNDNDERLAGLSEDMRLSVYRVVLRCKTEKGYFLASGRTGINTGTGRCDWS